jgi:hypothetical protein
MRLISIDLSLNTGIAVFDIDETNQYKLIHYYTIFGKEKTDKLKQNDPLGNDHPYDMYYKVISFINKLMKQILLEINPMIETLIIIEQTNRSMNRATQKILEWLHFSLCTQLINNRLPIKYIDTSEWRKLLNIKVDDEVKAYNKRLKRKKEKGLINIKHVTIFYVNETFNLELKPKDENTADAICLGCAQIKIMQMGQEYVKQRFEMKEKRLKEKGLKRKKRRTKVI